MNGYSAVVFGASDPEAQLAESIAREAGCLIGHAHYQGRRVSPGDAYRADDVRWLSVAPEQIDLLLRFECDGPAIDALAAGRTVVCDHHRPGDPGYGRPPAEFLPASSIGQLLAALGQPNDQATAAVLPPEVVLCAAADHCLAAAYRGECPGVDPDALMRWRVESRAAFQQRPVEAVLADVEAARRRLRNADRITLTGPPDVGGYCPGCGEHVLPDAKNESWDYCTCPTACDLRGGAAIPELPEASAREGLCFIADGLPGPDGRVKIVCQSGTPEQIRAFMAQWAPAHGLADIYGDPARGFAGGYQ